MNNTIFDDVFRTMIEKMPYLAVPLINEVFHTSYSENVKITQLRNEHQQEDGDIITDSCLLIGKKMYHIECQSTDDVTMAIRMIEYDFAIGIEHAEKQGRGYRIEFPKSCVLFLRSSGNTPDYLKADVVFPDGNTYLYSIPTIKMTDYTKDSIFEKNLLMLLPFYIMRYEKKGHDFNSNPELFQVFLNEYEEIRVNLEEELTETGKSELYTDLTKLIIKIADYIFRGEDNVRKGIGDIMGGKVLELESERLKAEGKAIGRAEGEAIGQARGEVIGQARGEAIGQIQGEARLGSLITRLIQDQRTEEIPIVSTDSKRREQLYKEYSL